MLFWTLIASLVASLGGLALYVYSLYTGQFDDPESVKYQLFREDDPDN